MDWTNLPLKPIFLPLLARLTFELAGADTERTMALAGAPVTMPLGKGTEPARGGRARRGRGRPPLGRGRSRTSPSPALVRTLRYTDTHEAGIYLVRMTDRSPTKQLAFAVNIDPAESDPATILARSCRPASAHRPLLFCESPAELAATIQQLREGTSLWEWFLSAVLIGLVLEVFLANRGTAAVQRPRWPAHLPGRGSLFVRADPVTPEDDCAGFLGDLEADAAESLRG